MLSFDGHSHWANLVHDFDDMPSAELKSDDYSTTAAASQEANKGITIIDLLLKLVELNLYIWIELFI